MNREALLAMIAAVHAAAGGEFECGGQTHKPEADDACMAVAGDVVTELARRGFAVYRKRGRR